MLHKVLYIVAALALVAGNLAIASLGSSKSTLQLNAAKNNCPIYYGCPPAPPSTGGNGNGNSKSGGNDNSAPKG